jgi:hypothetical protein
MLHLLFYLIRYLTKSENDQSQHLSRAQVKAQIMEHKLMGISNLSRLTKDDIIKEMGEPDKIKNTDNGMQSLIWKGRKHKIEIFVDALDRFDHKTESYT